MYKTNTSKVNIRIPQDLNSEFLNVFFVLCFIDVLLRWRSVLFFSYTRIFWHDKFHKTTRVYVFIIISIRPFCIQFYYISCVKVKSCRYHTVTSRFFGKNTTRLFSCERPVLTRLRSYENNAVRAFYFPVWNTYWKPHFTVPFWWCSHHKVKFTKLDAETLLVKSG